MGEMSLLVPPYQTWLVGVCDHEILSLCRSVCLKLTALSKRKKLLDEYLIEVTLNSCS
jgi:hypothetical protein